MNDIQAIVEGLIEVVGSNNVYDILDHLNIELLVVNKDRKILRNNKAVYNRIAGNEYIYLSNEDGINKEFILAHELGHAILHYEEGQMFYNPLLNKGKLEREANYFATLLLYKDLVIEDGIETKQQLADSLGVNEDVINYIINK